MTKLSNRLTFFKIWERSGCLTLATKDDGRLATMVTAYIPRQGGRDRAFFLHNENGYKEIYNPGETYREQIAELAHAYSLALKLSYDKVPSGVSNDDAYGTLNLREFNDHGCVEPVIDDVLRNQIPYQKMDTEIHRRLKAVQKLSECGITYLRSYRNEIIHGVSNLMTEMGCFGAGEKPMTNVYALYEGMDDKLEWTRKEDGSLVGDQELVIHWMYAFQKTGDKNPDSFFKGLKKIKETLNVISKDPALYELAKQNNIKASDVAALVATSGKMTKETLSQYFSNAQKKAPAKDSKTGLKETLKHASLDNAVTSAQPVKNLIATVQRRHAGGRG